MCLGELGRVLSRDDDVALVRTERGVQRATLLLTPAAAVGDDVVVHSGHVLTVVGPRQAVDAAALRSGRHPADGDGAPTAPT